MCIDMSRLGLWGKGTSYPGGAQDLVSEVVESVGMMELLALHLKRKGSFLCRTLSFSSCSFSIIDNCCDQGKRLLLSISLYNISPFPPSICVF